MLLLFYPLYSVADNNDVVFESLKLTIKDHLKNREGIKNREDIKKF